MKKPMKLLFLVVIMLLIPAFTEANNGYLNNNNVLMLPARQTFEKLGYNVRWVDGSIYLESDYNRVAFSFGREHYLHNDQIKPFGVLPKLANSSIYISECFLEAVAPLTMEERHVDTTAGRYMLSYKNAPTRHNNNDEITYDLQGDLFSPYPFIQETVKHVPILMYHMIDDPALYRGIGHYKKYLVHPDSFRSQLRWLQENGYHAVTMEDLFAHWVSGKPILENPVIITFDDGYACAYNNALPELVRYDMVGSVFVCSANMDGNRYLSAEMLLALLEKGVEIGSHSVAHANLTGIGLEDAEREIAKSKKDLETITGTDVHFFSYPFGAYNSTILDLVNKHGYLGAVTTAEGCASYQEGMFRLSRIFVDHADELECFAQKITSCP